MIFYGGNPRTSTIVNAKIRYSSTFSSWLFIESPIRKRTRRSGALSRAYYRVSPLAPNTTATVSRVIRQTEPSPSSGSHSLIQR